MKKIIIILIVLVLSGGGAFVYLSFFSQPAPTIWSFVPADAVVVYESGNPLLHWKENKEKKIWKNLHNLPLFANTSDQLQLLDSISDNALDDFFEKNDFLMSFHVTSKTSMDALFYISVNGLAQHDMLGEVIGYFKDEMKMKERKRQYLGYTITELAAEQSVFTYIFYKNYFIASFTPFLVEDAIRVIEDVQVASFEEEHRDIFGVTRLEQDQGNIFFNTAMLDQLTGMFVDPLAADVSSLADLTHISFLDLAIHEDNLLMTGFSLNEPVKKNYLSVFDQVSSSELTMTEVLPGNTAALIHYSYDNAQKWHQALENYWSSAGKVLLSDKPGFEQRYSVQLSDLYGFLDAEIGLIVSESINPERPDLVVAMKVSNDKAANEFFGAMADATLNEEDPYQEFWADVPLRHIEIPELPQQFFGPGFSGFPSSFYCLKNGFAFLANNEQVLKQLIDQIDAEDTWRKSIKVNNFLDIANKEANLSLFVRTSGAWNIIETKLHDQWLKFFDEYAFALKQIEFAAFQFSNVDGKYYTNIALQHPGKIVERVEAPNFEVKDEQLFNHKVITRPYVVKNHNDGSFEVLLQDSLRRVYLVSSDRDTLWSRQLDGQIQGEVYQLDYYKNGKLQCLLTTGKSIHILDRTGEYIPGYPFELPDHQLIEKLSLIDYDNSRKYRIMAATADGKYYLYDKAGKNLEGWTPKILEGKPVMTPFHLRVRSRDFMMFMHRSGLVYVLNRRGEPVKGFPVDLKGTVENPLFIQKAGTVSGTSFTTVTNEGEVVRFNLEGKFLKREQLFKSTAADRFHLVVSSTNQRTYLILRQDDEKITVIDAKGRELFNHNFSHNKIEAKYYNFSPDNAVIVITDKDKNYTYLYSIDGRLMHALPLETGEEIAMIYYESKGVYTIYKTHDKALSVLTLAR